MLLLVHPSDFISFGAPLSPHMMFVDTSDVSLLCNVMLFVTNVLRSAPMRDCSSDAPFTLLSRGPYVLHSLPARDSVDIVPVHCAFTLPIHVLSIPGHSMLTLPRYSVFTPSQALRTHPIPGTRCSPIPGTPCSPIPGTPCSPHPRYSVLTQFWVLRSPNLRYSVLTP